MVLHLHFRRRVADPSSSTAFWLLLALANPAAAAYTKGVRCPWSGGTRRGTWLVLALANPAVAAVTDGARGQGPGGRPRRR
uniref:Secreted protein n=1 Tax=Oryza meridionalis TaxID=40149 RepID=A0A0E0C195_9ORYZ